MAASTPRSSSYRYVSLGFVLALLLIFALYVAYSCSVKVSAGNEQLLSQASCQPPYPGRPANTETYLQNGTVETTSWLAVLVMPENTTGQICINYSNNWNNFVQSQVYYNINRMSGGTVSSSGTSLPSISASPSEIYLYLGSNQTVTYAINSGSNTTGIYSVGTLQSCPGTPLAVGYQGSQLNISDFSQFLGIFNCPSIDLMSTVVGVSNIQVDYLPIHSSYTMTYNITSSSVVSINPSPDIQNVTFNLHIQSHATAINVSFDSQASSIVRLSADPNLSKLPANDSCSWYPNNSQALASATSSPLETSSTGNVTLDAPSISIPAYSLVNYSFSIQLENLSKNYYYSLGPTINIVSVGAEGGGNGSTLQSVAAYYPVNIGQSDFSGSASQLLSGSC